MVAFKWHHGSEGVKEAIFMRVVVRFSSSDYLLVTMARFCVVVVTAVCCLVTGSFGDDDAAGSTYGIGQEGRYTQLVTGIAHLW